MADEISLASDLKESLERTKWTECGVCGFLIGRVWRGHVNVLNVWVDPSSDANSQICCKDLKDNLTACQDHLSGGMDIVGVVVVTKALKKSSPEEYLDTLPPEVQVAVSGPLFVVCHIQMKAPQKQSLVAFCHYSVEEKSLERVTERPVVEGFDEETVIFRLQACFPMQLQLDNSQPTVIEAWESKMTKAFSNIETSVSSGGYTYRFRDTLLFLSENSVIGSKGKMSSVQHLYEAVTSDVEGSGSKKSSFSRKPPLMVDLYQQVSGEMDHFAKPTCAPAVHQRTGSFRFLHLVLPVDAVVEVDRQERVGALHQLFHRAIVSQLRAMQHCLHHHQSQENEFYTPEPFHFSIPQRHTCVTVIYPRGISDIMLGSRRKCLHQKMCLGLDRPMFRRGNARLFPGQLVAGGYLINPHIGLPPSRVSGGTPHLVQGNYTYHHYMQDRFDDDKWGCAYRSLQTLVSWFRLQGYTDQPIPSHREIQKALVVVGDKEPSFVGSKKWIGSFEVSYCLDNMIGVTSKFLNVSAGADLASKGRELAMHFDTEGTPIMIGGGVLAHTILGVDYSETSGDIKFLILDPHYTGGEDLHTVQKEGWCGWKGPEFWNPTAHYNLCMPGRPAGF
ncbi:ufm1-specific protease 2-like [Babylonia areolata]|uniref:ufm1-specific protease 2-like n=1 Tax=Babylonia areolata TaxID=304850 RepID=UPI003FD05A07